MPWTHGTGAILANNRKRSAALFGSMIPPVGFVFLVDTDGAYLLDTDGTYLVEAI